MQTSKIEINSKQEGPYIMGLESYHLARKKLYDNFDEYLERKHLVKDHLKQIVSILQQPNTEEEKQRKLKYNLLLILDEILYDPFSIKKIIEFKKCFLQLNPNLKKVYSRICKDYIRVIARRFTISAQIYEQIKYQDIKSSCTLEQLQKLDRTQKKLVLSKNKLENQVMSINAQKFEIKPQVKIIKLSIKLLGSLSHFIVALLDISLPIREKAIDDEKKAIESIIKLINDEDLKVYITAYVEYIKESHQLLGKRSRDEEERKRSGDEEEVKDDNNKHAKRFKNDDKKLGTPTFGKQ